MREIGTSTGIYQHGQELAWGIIDPEFEDIAADSGILPHKIDINAEREFSEVRANTLGVGVSMTVGPYKKTATVTGSVIDMELLFSTDNAFTYDGDYYVVTNISQVQDHKNYVEATVTGEAYAGITAEET